MFAVYPRRIHKTRPGLGDEPASKYTRAKLFQNKGEKTPVTIRFSTVIGERDSAETARDPRGFAVKSLTEDGNWDLVVNNIAVLFIRDAIKSTATASARASV